MLWLALLGQAVWACTLTIDGKVVGFHPSGDLALIRLETSGGEHTTIELVVLDTLGNEEKQRLSILSLDDGDDQQKRAANWARAEQEVTAMGIVVDASIKPVPTESKNGYPKPIVFPDLGATLHFEIAREGGKDEAMKLLLARVAKGGETSATTVLARWPWGSSGNSYHYVFEVWRQPGKPYVLVEDTRRLFHIAAKR